MKGELEPMTAHSRIQDVGNTKVFLDDYVVDRLGGLDMGNLS
jgi:hypothetical protein